MFDTFFYFSYFTINNKLLIFDDGDDIYNYTYTTTIIDIKVNLEVDLQG